MTPGNSSLDATRQSIAHMIKIYDGVISHYDFVIQDISGDIYNPVLQAQKGTVIPFLTAVRQEWEKCRADLQRQLDSL